MDELEDILLDLERETGLDWRESGEGFRSDLPGADRSIDVELTRSGDTWTCSTVVNFITMRQSGRHPIKVVRGLLKDVVSRVNQIEESTAKSLENLRSIRASILQNLSEPEGVEMKYDKTWNDWVEELEDTLPTGWSTFESNDGSRRFTSNLCGVEIVLEGSLISGQWRWASRVMSPCENHDKSKSEFDYPDPVTCLIQSARPEIEEALEGLRDRINVHLRALPFIGPDERTKCMVCGVESVQEDDKLRCTNGHVIKGFGYEEGLIPGPC